MAEIGPVRHSGPGSAWRKGALERPTRFLHSEWGSWDEILPGRVWRIDSRFKSEVTAGCR